MELEMKKNSLDHFETGVESAWTQEETAETIVPDYCPDIARIVTTNGCAYLHSRELRDGKAELSGNLRLTVLYIPEGENDLRTLDITIPFSTDASGFTACQHLLAETEIEFLDTRMLNPRKVFTHCKLVHRGIGYRRTQLCFSSDCDSNQQHQIEKRQEQQQAILLTSISEKDFTFTDEIGISAGRCGISELLYHHVTPITTETKLVGSKLIFKGIFNLQILYRATDGKCAFVTVELPFSQIMETESAGEDASVTLRLQTTGADLQPSNEGDDRRIDVTLYLHAAVLLRESRNLTILSDLYSISCETTYEAVPLALTAHREYRCQRQTIREVLEIGTAGETLLSLWAQCGPASVSREEKTTALRSSVLVRALVLDASNTLVLAERNLDVTSQIDLPADCQITVRSSCPDFPQGTLGDRGVEVRLTVEFEIEITNTIRKVCIASAKLDTDTPKNIANAPSLVLRCLGSDESTWDLAKNCNSTIPDILAANQLEGEWSIPRGQLLLIPRKRA